MRLTAFIFAVLAALAVSQPAAAQNSRLDAFFGGYAGTAVAQNRDSEYFNVTVRDLDFSIEGHGEGGFKLSWTTITRHHGTPRNPEEERNTAELTFEPVDGRDGVFRASSSGNPLDSDYLSWARIEGQTLTVYVMTIDENGVYQVASWARTLVAGGMQILFTRVSDGDQVRTVNGRALRQR